MAAPQQRWSSVFTPAGRCRACWLRLRHAKRRALLGVCDLIHVAVRQPTWLPNNIFKRYTAGLICLRVKVQP